ncbi:hypothetical protein D9M68_856890 [compost metagenome]
MPGQRQRQIVRSDATTVVTHPQQLDPTLLDIHLDAPGARVQAVLEQFLDHRSRPLDHLARGDLVGQARTQQLDTRLTVHG